MGHIYMFQEAAQHGKIVVGLNSDEWLTRKKGKPFMTWMERASIVGNMKDVKDVMEMDDSDGTACDGIRKIYEKHIWSCSRMFFGNGGDRNPNSVPSKEQIVCEELGIGLLWGLGGERKFQSSSWLLDKWKGNE